LAAMQYIARLLKLYFKYRQFCFCKSAF